MPDRYWPELYRYWTGKHRNGIAPSRNDIDPVIEIPRLVKNLLLVDIRDRLTYRLIGSEVARRHGLDMTGRRAGTSGGNPVSITAWRGAIDDVVAERKPRLLVSRIRPDSTVRNAVLLLPLLDSAGDVEMILAGSFYDEQFQAEMEIVDMTTSEIDL